MLITVDFDGTLTRPEVQSFVRKAIADGHKVVIVTSRHTEKVSNMMYGENLSGWNSDIIELGTKLGCDKIYFTNQVDKYKYVAPLNSDIHLDDDNQEIKNINVETNTVALDVKKADWINYANRILEKRSIN